MVSHQTNHSPNFKQVLICQQEGLDVAQTSFATKLSPRLIEEHRRLIEDYRQTYANLPNGTSSDLEALLRKLDSHSNNNQPSPTS